MVLVVYEICRPKSRTTCRSRLDTAGGQARARRLGTATPRCTTMCSSAHARPSSGTSPSARARRRALLPFDPAASHVWASAPTPSSCPSVHVAVGEPEGRVRGGAGGGGVAGAEGCGAAHDGGGLPSQGRGHHRRRACPAHSLHPLVALPAMAARPVPHACKSTLQASDRSCHVPATMESSAGCFRSSACSEDGTWAQATPRRACTSG